MILARNVRIFPTSEEESHNDDMKEQKERHMKSPKKEPRSEMKTSKVEKEGPPSPPRSMARFEQVKGQARKTWTGLTDDDFKKANGSVDKLYGVIQNKFGDSKENIEKKLGQSQAK
jgi:uncharacterized protein YjbJ (UPF0337 family)